MCNSCFQFECFGIQIVVMISLICHMSYVVIFSMQSWCVGWPWVVTSEWNSPGVRMTAIGGGSNAPCCDGLRILGPSRMEGVSQHVTGSCQIWSHDLTCLEENKLSYSLASPSMILRLIHMEWYSYYYSCSYSIWLHAMGQIVKIGETLSMGHVESFGC